mmetsp:Transcript_13543/g.21104  ORF Transcript_13543/g.21104 Transcript_13543/m.21104 type:complete len:237 (-) Transcript_13543:83-793(-)
MANVRAANYGLVPMDWITVKIKAGRIVPALATTTAAIAGLQTIEVLKILKHLPLEATRNAFLNLAVPSLMLGEPGPPEKQRIGKDIEFDLWTRFEVIGNEQSLLKDVVVGLQTLFGKEPIEIRDIFFGSTPVFMYVLEVAANPTVKGITEFPKMQSKLLELLNPGKTVATLQASKEIPQFIDLMINFALISEDGTEEKVKSAPMVRVILEELPQWPPLDDSVPFDYSGVQPYGDDD